MGYLLPALLQMDYSTQVRLEDNMVLTAKQIQELKKGMQASIQRVKLLKI